MVRPGVSTIVMVVGTAVVGPAAGRVVSRVSGPVRVVGGAAVGTGGGRALPVGVRGAAAVWVGEVGGPRPFLVRRGVAVAVGGSRALPVGVRFTATPGVSAGSGA